MTGGDTSGTVNCEFFVAPVEIDSGPDGLAAQRKPTSFPPGLGRYYNCDHGRNRKVPSDEPQGSGNALHFFDVEIHPSCVPMPEMRAFSWKTTAITPNCKRFRPKSSDAGLFPQ